MGFKKPQKVGVLDYTGTDYDGVEVKANLSISLATFFEIERLRQEEDTEGWMRHFMEHCVVEWNLEEEDGTPTPVTFEGFASWPPEFAILTIKAWMEAVMPSVGPLEQQDGLDLASISNTA